MDNENFEKFYLTGKFIYDHLYLENENIAPTTTFTKPPSTLNYVFTGWYIYFLIFHTHNCQQTYPEPEQ